MQTFVDILLFSLHLSKSVCVLKQMSTAFFFFYFYGTVVVASSHLLTIINIMRNCLPGPEVYSSDKTNNNQSIIKL